MNSEKKQNNQENNYTHFGYQEVKKEDKIFKVKEVFDDVAIKYDIMNDFMSLGLHRIWKWVTCNLSNVRANQLVLDLAGGTGDLTKILAKKVLPHGKVILSDINSSMLSVGRDNMIDNNLLNVDYTVGNAECLPFADNMFDCVTMAFGLRNVTDKESALKSIYRVLKPGGKLLVLEFSKPIIGIVEKLYDFYSFNIIPYMGEIIAGKQEHYKYLVESIRKHPDQEKLKKMFEEAGFFKCNYHNFNMGIVALHTGYKV
tara:strand:+ start:5777 stop:6547 length:771 start_codon:yes stop_codon:yes gene_type:complete